MGVTSEFRIGLLILPVLLLFLAQPSYQQKHVQEKAILNRILGAPYDRNLRPSGNGSATAPVTVAVNLYVRSIDKVDSVKMEWSTQLTFRQQYQDDRLRWDNLNVSSGLRYLSVTSNMRESKDVWRPDLFFSNEKHSKIHDLMSRNEYTRIFPNGEVLLSSRISLTLSCPMMMKRYPHDSQTCSMRMASYGYTTEDIIFKWKKADPVQVTSDLHFPSYILTQFTTDYCDSQTNTGIYSCLRLDLNFKREFNPYLINIYIPCVMFVLVSWVSFWISKDAVTARVIISLVTLLAMTFHVAMADKNRPHVMYNTAIDTWTGICLTFVFATLLEFATVHYCSRRKQKRNDAQALIPAAAVEDEELPQSEQDAKVVKRSVTSPFQDFVAKCECCAQKLDMYSRIVFPLAFLLFVIIYWASYSGSEN